jgi:exopolysaccharide production protein ExoZ
MEMIWSLQILRFAAALMVVYFHAEEVAFVATGCARCQPPRQWSS